MSTVQRTYKGVGDGASRREFVRPSVVRHGGLHRLTAQGGGNPVQVTGGGGGPPTAFSTPAVGDGID